MRRIFILYILLSFCLNASFAQTSSQLNTRADSNYNRGNFIAAAGLYLHAAEICEFRGEIKYDYYQAAASYTKAGENQKAFDNLQLAISYGYTFKDQLLTDSLFTTLHKFAKWQPLMNSIKARATTYDDPKQVKLITTDLDNFYQAFDLAAKDSTHRAEIYRKYYIDPASPGMDDYFAYKVRSMKKFMAGHDARPIFYGAIRHNVQAVSRQKADMIATFIKFKQLYPQAQFPDVYFVIGNFAAAGTVTPNGLLIGADQNVRTDDIPVDELTGWQKHNFFPLTVLPYVIAHELVHFQQNNMANDTTLLHGVIVEGMADFICELISGDIPSHRYRDYAQGREKSIWADFKKEMYLARNGHWIANGDTSERPSDLGYWVGYEICKSYYNKASDKQKAIYDMLHITNYRVFYEQSGVEKRLGL